MDEHSPGVLDVEIIRSGGHMARRNPIRSCRRRVDTIDEDAWPAWANIPSDILLVIIMKLGLIDFLALSSVCKPWRSSALSYRSTFLGRKEPLLLTLSKKVCTFIDIFDKRRRYKTVLGDSSCGFCVGVSCGYLIIFRQGKASGLYLVNPITRDELYFPPLPENKPYDYAFFRPILVYSSQLSKFVVVILSKRDNHSRVRFSGSDDSKWVVLPNPGQDWDIVDLTFFKGKIYMLNSDGRVGEMKLNPSPSLEFLDVKKRMPSLYRELVSSGERLFMVDLQSRVTVKHEFDFEKMEWVVKDDLGECSLFVNRVKSSAVVNSTNWLGGGKAQCNSTYILPLGINAAKAWYFPHECYNNNILADS